MTYAAAKQVAAANRSFYRAFEALDAEAMRDVWLDDPSIKCVHPGGEMLVGVELVHAAWEAIFRSTEGIAFEIADLAIDVQGEAAWVTALERIRSAGQPEAAFSEAAATNVFVLREGRWRMVLHHASPVTRRFFR
ncbi:MAG: nuclear transport factor 2 family protein [Planctomycetota bacterium]